MESRPPAAGGPGRHRTGGRWRSAEASGSWAKVYPVHSTITTAGLGLGLLWFRTGGDAIQAFVMGGLSPWVGFWLLRRFLRQAPRRRKPPPQSENAMLEPRRESQDIAELKADVSALKAEIRAGRSLHGTIKYVIVLYLRIARFRLLEPPFPSPWMIADRSSPSRVRCAASRPGWLRADLGRRAVHEGKGGGRACGRAEREPFGHTRRLSRSRGALSPAGP